MPNKYTRIVKIPALIALSVASLAAQTPAAGVAPTAEISPFPKQYMRLEGGVSVVNDVSVKASSSNLGDLAAKAGPALSLSYGYRTTGQSYLEGEISYSKNDWDDGFTGGVSSVGILSNFVTVSNPSSNSRLYWGFGAGSTILRADIGVSKLLSLPPESQACLTGQVKALWEFKTSETNTFSLGYRFKFIDGPSFSSGLSTNKITAHFITAGYSFAF